MRSMDESQALEYSELLCQQIQERIDQQKRIDVSLRDEVRQLNDKLYNMFKTHFIMSDGLLRESSNRSIEEASQKINHIIQNLLARDQQRLAELRLHPIERITSSQTLLEYSELLFLQIRKHRDQQEPVDVSLKDEADRLRGYLGNLLRSNASIVSDGIETHEQRRDNLDKAKLAIGNFDREWREHDQQMQQTSAQRLTELRKLRLQSGGLTSSQIREYSKLLLQRMREHRDQQKLVDVGLRDGAYSLRTHLDYMHRPNVMMISKGFETREQMRSNMDMAKQVIDTLYQELQEYDHQMQQTPKHRIEELNSRYRRYHSPLELREQSDLLCQQLQRYIDQQEPIDTWFRHNVYGVASHIDYSLRPGAGLTFEEHFGILFYMDGHLESAKQTIGRVSQELQKYERWMELRERDLRQMASSEIKEYSELLRGHIQGRIDRQVPIDNSLWREANQLNQHINKLSRSIARNGRDANRAQDIEAAEQGMGHLAQKLQEYDPQRYEQRIAGPRAQEHHDRRNQQKPMRRMLKQMYGILKRRCCMCLPE